eukprot:11931.XXX_299268_296934_1 [CDS] Oithona nana genome sequencing.
MPPKGKGKQKSPGKDLDIAQHAGMLDAYTDGGSSSSPITKDDTKPVTKKNKNQKKREAEKLRKLSESESKPEVPEVIDSWEDLESNTDETQVPRSIEFPVKPAAEAVVESLVEEVQKLKIEEDKPKKQDGVQTKLQTLESTMAKLDALFANKEVPMPTKKEVKSEVKTEVKSDKKTEKTKEEIKAEREAKKKAKSAAKDQAKNMDNDQNEKTDLPEKKEEPSQKSTDKSPEEIKAEREAKKKAKQAAKEMSKNKSKDPKDKPDIEKSVEKPKVEGEKSKAELKKERREKQEEQRRKKEEEAAKKKEDTKKEKVKRVPDEIQADRASVEKKLAKRLASQQISARTKAQRKVMLFSHLHQYEREFSLSRSYPIVGAHIHPSILTLGLQYADGIIAGSNARCIGLMKALKDFICDYTTPENSELSRDLNDKLKPQITFLKECRPISVSMGNAIRFIKSRINAVPNGTSEIDAKEGLMETIDEFVQHNIILAAEQIAITACEKICDGDVILTYGCSSLLRKVFAKADLEGRKFRIIIADGRPKFEGKEMARQLTSLGLHCTYVLVSSVPYIMQEVTKVFIGAHAVLANGCVMSRVGTSQVTLVAKSQNVPVLVCCETYKFSERVQTDSFVFNELGDPDDLVETSLAVNPLEDWRDLSALTLLNLTYDVTPANLVDAIISEVSVIPGTSVPVVLRLKNSEYGN